MCSSIVTIAEIDKQRVVLTITGEYPVTTVKGLALLNAKAGKGAKKRWKPARGGKAVRMVAGSLRESG